MAKLLVRIEIPGDAADLRQEIAESRADPEGTESWVSTPDGLDNVLIDEGYLTRSRVDDSFFVFEFVAVED
jgi:hypothetical protein